MTRANYLASLACAAVLVAGSSGPALRAKPFDYKVPESAQPLKPGANLDAVENNCSACHSHDYIKTQPQGPAFKKAFWQAEVTKMIKVYGAPIDDADVGKIVDYLSENY